MGTGAGACSFSSAWSSAEKQRAVRLGGSETPGCSGLASLWVPSVCVPEMAERHNTKQILKLARDLVYKVQTLIENK